MKHHLRCLLNKSEKISIDVSEDVICSVYRFEKPACSIGSCQTTCKYISSCLNGLLKKNVLDEPPCNEHETEHAVERTQVHNRNGLKNYGSTCYLNAFLQLYFRFKELRKAIYNVAPQADETGIIHQLQLIFSQLQLSNSGVVDPGGLIEALRLCNTEQQDAPEFHCLFMNLLEARFQQVGVSVIDNLIRGEYTYETICSTCGFTSRLPSKFLELSLKVSSKSLPDCIRDYLKEEHLIGDNQYACSQCGCKRNGVRRAYITRAPSLLCIQLLRFTYDSKTGQRKKYKASIRLPDLLELTKVVNNQNYNKHSSSEHSVACLSTHSDPPYRAYRLCGILLHIGNQPTSGHYIAVLRDSYKSSSTPADKSTELHAADEQQIKLDECWSVCNDTDVFTIPSHQFKLAKINGSAKSLQSYLTSTETSETPTNQNKVDQPLERCSYRKAKKRRCDILSTNTSDITNLDENIDCTISEIPSQNGLWHSSTNAYMIFYESVDNCNMDQDIPVPAELIKTIEEVNLIEQAKHASEIHDRVNRKNQLLNLLSELKLPDPPSSLLNECSSITKSPLSGVSLVSTSWLSDCLNHPSLLRDPTLSTSSYENQEQTLLRLKGYIFPPPSSNQSSYSLRLCPHGCFPTDLVAGSYRAVSTEGLKKLVEILFPESVNNDVSESAKFDQFQPCKKCISLNAALLKLENVIKELSKEVDYFIRTNHLSFSLNKRIEDEKSEPESQDLEAGYYLVGKRSLRQWRTLARQYTRALYCDNAKDPDSQTLFHAQTTLNHDILCSHSQLCTENARHLPAILWHQLIDLFPGANIPTFPVLIPYNDNTVIDSSSILNSSQSPCSECNALHIDLTKRALCERQLLPGLFLSASQRMRLLHFTGQTAMMKMKEDTVNKSFLLSPKERKLDTDLGLHSRDSDSKTSTEKESNPDAIYLIPMDFVMQWKKFIKNPTAENMPISLSSGLSADGVLCEHDKMLKTWQMLIDESTLCPLSSYEWDVLSHAYPHRPQENDEPLDLSDLETKITTYPTMYLLPQHDSESSWRLEPSVYNTLCLECHSQLITINQTYNNARIRIRLVSGLDEAVSSSVQSASVNSSVTDPMMSLDSAATTNTCSQSEFINTNPDNPDQKMDNLNKIRCYFNERSTIEQSRAEKGAKPLTSFNATKVPTSPDHNREEICIIFYVTIRIFSLLTI
ncbi:unnamed protein product [Heterobilharzia americana]|nr:unnamed protein product [Heterobilharzia americana]